MSQGPFCPNLSKKVKKEVSQMANHNLSCAMLQGGLSVNLNHLKIGSHKCTPCNKSFHFYMQLKRHRAKPEFLAKASK